MSDAGRETFKDHVIADSPKCASWSFSSTAQSTLQKDASIQEGYFDILLQNGSCNVLLDAQVDVMMLHNHVLNLQHLPWQIF